MGLQGQSPQLIFKLIIGWVRLALQLVRAQRKFTMRVSVRLIR
jgi:hypothetical protein